MPETTPPNLADDGIEIRTYFVRSRHALLARADFGELFVDYYLHLSQHGLTVPAGPDAVFKRALAGFALHCASRPRNELTAWTVNFQEPLLNLFLAGDNGTGAVTGRVFTENVKEGPEGLFYADVVRGRQPPHRSVVGFQGGDPLAAAEEFYAGSEQRRARFFAVGEEELVLVTEHPDCDLAWLGGLTVDAVRRLDAEETLVPLERRVLRWHCGCNLGRMMEILAPAMRHDPQELFGTETEIEIRCPRCAGRHAIRRAELAAFVAGRE